MFGLCSALFEGGTTPFLLVLLPEGASIKACPARLLVLLLLSRTSKHKSIYLFRNFHIQFLEGGKTVTLKTFFLAKTRKRNYHIHTSIPPCSQTHMW